MEKAAEFQKTFPKLNMAGIKQFIDGVVTGYTAYMLDPYNKGNVMPYSSDYPVIPLNPMLGLYHAVTRKDYTLADT